MTRKLLTKRASLVFVILVISLIGIVYAAEVCCEKKIDDGWCVKTDESECDAEYSASPNDCEMTTFCKIGYCFDPETGFCVGGSPKARCTGLGGSWSEADNQGRCSLGCCFLGTNTQYTTEKACEIMAQGQGIVFNFSTSVLEEDCRYFSYEEGACVYDGNCKYTTEVHCKRNLHGDFYLGRYCSDQVTNYQKHDHEGCYDGDIYWFDDHDQREDIIKDCDIYHGECAVGSVGNVYCKDLRCEDEDGNIRRDGESWCVYDSYVGGGKDVVGSKHWIRTCEGGEIKVEACGGDYRGQICAEKVVNGVSRAQCRVNLGALCFEIDNKEECEDVPDCKWQKVDVDTYFNFGVCVPKYPKGFDFNSQDDMKNGEDVCSLASMTCVMQESKKILGSWKCKKNCDCRNKEFVEKMNEFCISLGDCGSYINYVGEGTDSYKVSGKNALAVLEECVSADICGSGCSSGLRCLLLKARCMYYGECINGEYFVKDKFDVNWQDYLIYLTKENLLSNIPQYLNIDESIGIWGDEINIAGIVKTDFEVNLNFFDGFFSGWKRVRTARFECLPWKPPVGGDNCSKCNDDPLKPCSEYRCESLGTACGLMENVYEEENPICHDKYSSDTDPPVISFDSIQSGYRFTPTTSGGSIKKTNGDCIYEYSAISFSLKTDEPAECRWSVGPLPIFDLMPASSFEEGNSWALTHRIINLSIYGGDEFKMYIRCMDYAGNWQADEYIIDFCISPLPDESPPIVLKTDPASGSYLKKGVTKTPIKVYLNEPVECKYNKNPYVDYENMETEMACNTDEQTDENSSFVMDWYCLTELTGLSEDVNTRYIRCNDSSGNIMQQDYTYILYATTQDLEITSISPENSTLIEQPISIETPLYLEVTTSGGANNGNADCEWKIVGTIMRDLFTETGSTTHRYKFTGLGDGDFEIEVTCEDEAGNLAIATTHFSIDADREAPVIIENYTQGSALILVTDESADCYYKKDDCSFELDDEDAVSITSGSFDLEHRISEFSARNNYYIRCKDEWGNEGCSLTILATEGDDGLPPQVIRIYRDVNLNDLVIITNKESKCYYSLEGCDFEIENSVEMYRISDYSVKHTTNWNQGVTYYIKCVDYWENKNTDCAVIVRPS